MVSGLGLVLLVLNVDEPSAVAAFQVAMDDPEFEKMMVGRGHEMLRLSGDEAEAYMKRWQSVTSWLLYEGGSAKASPEEFGIPKP